MFNISFEIFDCLDNGSILTFSSGVQTVDVTTKQEVSTNMLLYKQGLWINYVQYLSKRASKKAHFTGSKQSLQQLFLGHCNEK